METIMAESAPPFHQTFILESRELCLSLMIPTGSPWLPKGNGHRLKWSRGGKQSFARRSWPALGYAYLSPRSWLSLSSPEVRPPLRIPFLSVSLSFSFMEENSEHYLLWSQGKSLLFSIGVLWLVECWEFIPCSVISSFSDWGNPWWQYCAPRVAPPTNTEHFYPGLVVISSSDFEEEGSEGSWATMCLFFFFFFTGWVILK